MKRLLLLVLFLLVAFYIAWPAFTGYRIHSSLQARDPAALAQRIDFPSVRQSMRGPVVAQVRTRLDAVVGGLGPAAKLAGGGIPDARIEQIVDGALATAVTPEQVLQAYAEGGDFSQVVKGAILAEIDKLGGFGVLLGLSGNAGGNGDNGAGASIGGLKLPGGLAGLFKNEKIREAVGEIAGKAGLDPAQLAGKLFPGFGGSSGSSSSQRRDGIAQPAFGLGNIKSFGFEGPLAMQLGIARDSAAKGADVTAEMSFDNLDWRITKLIPNLLEVQ